MIEFDVTWAPIRAAEPGLKVNLNLPTEPVDDNKPVDFTVTVDPDLPFTISRMWNEPVGTSPQNKIGTTDMSFTDEGSGNVHIEKAIWYGNAPSELCYDYTAEQEVFVEVNINGATCTGSKILKVKLKDDGPPVPVFHRDYQSHASYYGELPLPVYVQIIGPSIISKTGQILHAENATSQYKDMILQEEAAHENQWYGCVINSAAGLPSFHNGDLYLLEENVIDTLVATGGVYDSGARTIRFLGHYQSTVRGYVNDATRSEFDRVNSCAHARQCIIEKTAKELVGWLEAYTYECTYMPPRGPCLANPTSPCP